MSNQKKNQTKNICCNPKHQELTKVIEQQKLAINNRKRQYIQLEEAHIRQKSEYESVLAELKGFHSAQLDTIAVECAGKVSKYAAIALVVGLIIGVNV